MRVALEQTVLQLDRGGTARAIQGLSHALGARPEIDIVHLAHPAWPRGGRITRGLDRELRWMPLALPRRARQAGVDVLHCPAAVGPIRHTHPPLVVTVNDMLTLDHPGWFTRANALQQRLVLPRLAANAAAVVTPSAWSRDRLVARLRVDPEKVHVIPWAVGPPFSAGRVDRDVLARHGIDGPYVVTVGTLQPRKGLEALARLESDHRIVIVGARGWRDDEDLERLRGRAVLLGGVPDRELVELLRGADALVFPSRHEGFGFPPLEAMACGTPVVAMRASAVPEVTGEAAELADPDDPRGLERALERVLTSPARRSELREAGLRRAGELSWERCAEAHLELYRRVARAAPRSR